MDADARKSGSGTVTGTIVHDPFARGQKDFTVTTERAATDQDARRQDVAYGIKSLKELVDEVLRRREKSQPK